MSQSLTDVKLYENEDESIIRKLKGFSGKDAMIYKRKVTKYLHTGLFSKQKNKSKGKNKSQY